MENPVQIPSLAKDEYYYISPEGFARLGSIYNSEEPLKHTIWTTDYTVELPIAVKKSGPGTTSTLKITNINRF